MSGGTVLAVLSVLGVAYCLGGLHGLWLAWTQEVRIRRWARLLPDTSARVCERVLDAYDKGGSR